MNIIKEKLAIEETLKNKITYLLKFQNIKGKLINGNIISIPKTNLAYIEPHKLVLENNTYLFFNECKEVYINTLEQSIPFEDLENYIKTNLVKIIDFSLKIVHNNKHFKKGRFL